MYALALLAACDSDGAPRVDASTSPSDAPVEVPDPPRPGAPPPSACPPYNLLSNPSFEDAPAVFGPPWKREGEVSLHSEDGASYRGVFHARLEGANGWSSVTQRVAVRPGADYVLSAVIQTARDTFGTGSIGLRTTTGEVLRELTFSAQAAYREQTLELNVGEHTLVDVVVGTRTPANGTWMRVDTLMLAPRGECDSPRVCTSCEPK